MLRAGLRVVSSVNTAARQRLLYRLEEPILELLHGAKNGVHAFGYYSAESEPIWMTPGAL